MSSSDAYDISEDRLRRLERCVETIADAIRRHNDGSLEPAAALQQVNDANLLISTILQEINVRPTELRRLGKRTPPKESGELAKQFKKKGSLY